MRIAFFTETYLPARDGVVSSILSFRRELERAGHQVYVFCPGTPKIKRENTDPAVFYHTAARFPPYPQYSVALFPFLSQRKVRSLGIDIVHSHGPGPMGIAAWMAARSSRKPLVCSFHTMIPEALGYIGARGKLKGITKKVAWGLLRNYYDRCDAVVAPSGPMGEVLTKRGFKRVVVVPNGVDLERFKPGVSGERVKRKHGISKKRVVLYVGRLAKEKNIDLLVRSALLILEERPDTAFLVVGTGPEEKNLKQLVNRSGLGGAFVFAGFVPDAELPAYYGAADLLAFPSTFETQGMVALEAMAAGKPVVAAAHPVLAEIVRPGVNGELFALNPDSCAHAVLTALAKPRKYAKGARKTASRFSSKQVTNKLVKLYERLLQKKPRTGLGRLPGRLLAFLRRKRPSGA